MRSRQPGTDLGPPKSKAARHFAGNPSPLIPAMRSAPTTSVARSSPAPRPAQSPRCPARPTTGSCWTRCSIPTTCTPRSARSPAFLGTRAAHSYTRSRRPRSRAAPRHQARPCIPRLSLPCAATALLTIRIQNACYASRLSSSAPTRLRSATGTGPVLQAMCLARAFGAPVTGLPRRLGSLLTMESLPQFPAAYLAESAAAMSSRMRAGGRCCS